MIVKDVLEIVQIYNVEQKFSHLCNAPSTHAFFSSRKMENSFRFFVFTSFFTSLDRLFKNINNFLYIKQSRLEKNEITQKCKT